MHESWPRALWLCACMIGVTLGSVLPVVYLAGVVCAGAVLTWRHFERHAPALPLAVALREHVTSHTLHGLPAMLVMLALLFASQDSHGRAPYWLLFGATVYALQGSPLRRAVEPSASHPDDPR